MHTVDQRVVSVPKRFGSVSEFFFGIEKKNQKKKNHRHFHVSGISRKI